MMSEPNWKRAMLDLPHKTEKSYADGKILQSVDDGVGVVTFNNPDKRNEIGRASCRERVCT